MMSRDWDIIFNLFMIFILFIYLIGELMNDKFFLNFPFSKFGVLTLSNQQTASRKVD